MPKVARQTMTQHTSKQLPLPHAPSESFTPTDPMLTQAIDAAANPFVYGTLRSVDLLSNIIMLVYIQHLYKYIIIIMPLIIISAVSLLGLLVTEHPFFRNNNYGIFKLKFK